MVALVALAVGYVVGARAGSKDLDQLAKSWKALRQSDEFADMMAAVRSHVGHTLRELASVVDGEDAGHDGGTRLDDGDDLVARVQHIFKDG